MYLCSSYDSQLSLFRFSHPSSRVLGPSFSCYLLFHVRYILDTHSAVSQALCVKSWKLSETEIIEWINTSFSSSFISQELYIWLLKVIVIRCSLVWSLLSNVTSLIWQSLYYKSNYQKNEPCVTLRNINLFTLIISIRIHWLPVFLL